MQPEADTALDTPMQQSVERSLRWLGALDHPFYDDERNRFVWYEASAIGAQVAIVGGYIAAGIMLLVYRDDAIGPMWIMMTPLVIASMLMAAYTARRSAQYLPTTGDLKTSRGLVHFLAGAFWVACYLFVEVSRGDGEGITIIGVLCGLAFGVAVAVVGGRMARRRQDQREAASGDD